MGKDVSGFAASETNVSGRFEPTKPLKVRTSPQSRKTTISKFEELEKSLKLSMQQFVKRMLQILAIFCAIQALVIFIVVLWPVCQPHFASIHQAASTWLGNDAITRGDGIVVNLLSASIGGSISLLLAFWLGKWRQRQRMTSISADKT